MHTLVVSFTGTTPDITDTFTILAAGSGAPDTGSGNGTPGTGGIPGTGDDPTLVLAMALLVAGGLVVCGGVLYRRRGRRV